MQFLNFEKHIADLEGKVKELTGLDLVGEKSENNDNEIKILFQYKYLDNSIIN